MSGFARRLQQGTSHSTSGTSGTAGTEPTQASTGPRSATTNTISGDYTTTGDGQVISNTHLTGTLYLKHANVVVNDCVIDGGVAINQYPGGNWDNPPVGGQKLAYCTFPSADNIGTAGIELDHCQVTGGQSTAMAFSPYNNPPLVTSNNVYIHDCWIDGMQSVSGSGYHIESIHSYGTTNITIQNNHISMLGIDSNTFNQVTAVLNLGERYGGDGTNIILDHNWLYGGSPYYQMLFYLSAGCRVTNNAFYAYTSPSDGSTIAPSVYTKSAFSGGGTAMSDWVDPTPSTVYGNTHNTTVGGPQVGWDLATIMAG